MPKLGHVIRQSWANTTVCINRLATMMTCLDCSKRLSRSIYYWCSKWPCCWRAIESRISNVWRLNTLSFHGFLSKLVHQNSRSDGMVQSKLQTSWLFHKSNLECIINTLWMFRPTTTPCLHLKRIDYHIQNEFNEVKTHHPKSMFCRVKVGDIPFRNPLSKL